MENLLGKILVVDDEKKIRQNICEILQLRGFDAMPADGGREALKIFADERIDAVVLDMKMPEMTGLEALAEFKKIDPLVPVIIVTAHGDIKTAVDAVKHGAYDFIPKPPDFEHLVITINRALEKLALERRVRDLDSVFSTGLRSRLGSSAAMQSVIKQLPKIAASDFSLLIQGDTGSGKTYLAKIIHGLSKRASKPFVKISIGSLPDTVIESELFGHEKGAFTGADRQKKGFFEMADGGTLFIDDLDNISAIVQGKLLNAIEDRHIFRVGSSSPIPLDIRIIGATNASLNRMVSDGRFRQDLLFRFGDVVLNIPPLRERPEDIEFFSNKFLLEACSDLNCHDYQLSEDSMRILQQYSWPGNIRQLRSVMRRVSLMISDNVSVNPDSIRLLLDPAGFTALPTTNMEHSVMSIKQAEKIAITEALAHTGGQKLKTAAILGIDYKTLIRKIQEYKI